MDIQEHNAVVPEKFIVGGTEFDITGQPIMVELFCGTAGVARSFENIGWRVIAIDKVSCIHLPRTQILSGDLTNSDLQRELLRLAEHPDLKYIHAAPPCGTSSRARDRPMPKHYRDAGLPDAKPARSELHPRGLPELEGSDPRLHLRVSVANILYDFAAKLMGKMSRLKKVMSVENPSRSYLWHIDEYKALLSPECGDVVWDMCAYGGARKMARRLRCCPVSAFLKLEAKCDNLHPHKSWTIGGRTSKFGTGEEAVYPDDFCQKLAECVVQKLKAMNLLPSFKHDFTSDTLIGTGVQPRGKKSKNLVPEYLMVLNLKVNMIDLKRLERQADKKDGSTIEINGHTIGNCKVLKVVGKSGEGRPITTLNPPSRATFSAWTPGTPGSTYIGRFHRDRQGRVHPQSRFANPFKVKDCANLQECLDKYEAHLKSMRDFPAVLAQLAGLKLVCHCRRDQPCHGDIIIQEFKREFCYQTASSDVEYDVRVGLYRTPPEYVEQACGVKHPFDEVTTDDAIKQAVAEILEGGVDATISRWRDIIARWRDRAARLERREADLHAALHKDVAVVLKGKRILLFREMLIESGFPNAQKLIDEMCAGFKVVGALDKTGVFAEKPRQAATSLECLWRTARATRSVVHSGLGKTGDRQLDEEVVKVTADEVERGWLKGPYTTEQLDQDLGLWVPARRFAIRQGDSIRAIDDYTVGGQNAATSVGDKMDLSGIDTVVSIARLLKRSVLEDDFAIDLSDGTRREGRVHQSLRAHPEVAGREWDLAKAYRQLASWPGHRSFNVVATYNVNTDSIEHYVQPVLAFGATSSVQNFCWTARALWHILVGHVGMIASHYVDNFPVVMFVALADAAKTTIDEFFDLLGWRTKNLEDFAGVFPCLGTVVHLGEFGAPIEVRNKVTRMDEIMSTIRDLRVSGRFTRAAARSLRGRLGFARAQVFGRIGAPALRMLTAYAEGHDEHEQSAIFLLDLLEWLVKSFVDSKPRQVPLRYGSPAILFTDGCCEDMGGEFPHVGIGAVLYLPDCDHPMIYSMNVGNELLSRWTASGRRQLIGQAEILPIVISKLVWANLLRDMALVTYVDNDSALHAVVGGYTSVHDSAVLIHAAAHMDMLIGCHQWVARVPSLSNPAAGPWQGGHRAPVGQGRRVHPDRAGG